MTPVKFRFDAGPHEYVDLETGAIIPHITGMLLTAGVVNDDWYTEDSSRRGTEVHALTSDYDLGALDPDGCLSRYRGYLLAHVQAMKILRPEFVAIEEPAVHPVYRFGGRPDRVIMLRGLKGVLEIKTTANPEPSHALQTALQCILVAQDAELPPHMLQRLCLYLKPNGRFRLVEHVDRHDFAQADKIIKRCCR